MTAIYGEKYLKVKLGEGKPQNVKALNVFDAQENRETFKELLGYLSNVMKLSDEDDNLAKEDDWMHQLVREIANLLESW